MVDAAPVPQDKTRFGLFAVTNVAELLERSAYYGFVSVFGLYLDSLGYGGAAIGAISVILLAFPYIIPLLSGALAEKVGYKPMMLGALALYTTGYGLLASTSSLAGILTGTTLVATGAGGFKPIATASIAHVTAERHRSLGYTIYYTGINVGGFLGPLTVALLTDSYQAGFVVAGVIMASALLLTLLAFRNPVAPQKEASVGQALAKLGAIFEDRRLVVLLLIFSGFWFLYSMNFSFLVLYLDRFVDLPSWFKPSLQQSINPLIVIFLGIPLGTLATKFDPRRMMTVGILLYLVGFTLLGFVPVFTAFLAGLFIATVGEILAYPAFLAYIARIAPKDRVAVYQSYGFLPLFIGFFFGPLATGPVFDALAVEASRPSLFWAVPITFGLLALVGFLLMAARDQAEAGPRRQATARALIVLLLVPALFAAGALAGTQDTKDGFTDGEPTVGLEAVAMDLITDSTAQGETTTVPFAIPSDARGNLTFTLRWTDEATTTPGASNRADAFRLAIFDVNGAVLKQGQNPNPVNGEGRVVLVVPAASPGPLRLDVTMISSGDQVVLVPLSDPVLLAADDANAWSLEPVKEIVPAAS